ncbi:PREDICTED: uncharacterized protein LOC108370503 [Rhagoletis zephyria]|uniref:uncharacterized protein LOC108370503 n=1 Tax=Rhagoletis zephyria TaxID=28612 RepID=UPI000811490A|nr:PREDICTED: uncharacterized protein LOC108370503 [Rhagoletis zephyria]
MVCDFIFYEYFSVSTPLKIRDIFNKWLEMKQCKKSLIVYEINKFVENHLRRSLHCTEETKIKFTILKFSTNWEKYGRKKDLFEKHCNNWLDSEIFYGDSICVEPSSSFVRGRPRVSFEEASHRTKRRRVDELVVSTSAEALKKAAEKISESSNSGTLSVEKALALYVDMDISYREYNMMRNVVNGVHKNCFPSYYSIVEAKKKLIPDGIEVSETSVHVPLQAILDKTSNSILKKLEFGAESDVILECKWGFDGSSGHSVYKQKFESQDATDEFLFVTSFVPLRIVEGKNEKIVWQNSKHSSQRLCRPLKILFAKENPRLIMEVKDNIQREIENLTTYVYNNDKKKINVQYRLKLTMIDGTVLNAIHGHKSCATCVLCGAKPTQMNT